MSYRIEPTENGFREVLDPSKKISHTINLQLVNPMGPAIWQGIFNGHDLKWTRKAKQHIHRNLKGRSQQAIDDCKFACEAVASSLRNASHESSATIIAPIHEFSVDKKKRNISTQPHITMSLSSDPTSSNPPTYHVYCTFDYVAGTVTIDWVTFRWCRKDKSKYLKMTQVLNIALPQLLVIPPVRGSRPAAVQRPVQQPAQQPSLQPRFHHHGSLVHGTNHNRFAILSTIDSTN
ncbi:hypothetical protein CC86DRAFT_385565 [Ophiobolus disseminans]|uniref:Uncharacterized protein n=1 Tax=Ophiobolus disseminans TaxID=1469910 RepID=A0A6A6ZNI3_9PLEO|nr:hypothetical protein CC86DRAFT_385565 [Ophiobolus disseminans]